VLVGHLCRETSQLVRDRRGAGGLDRDLGGPADLTDPGDADAGIGPDGVHDGRQQGRQGLPARSGDGEVASERRRVPSRVWHLSSSCRAGPAAPSARTPVVVSIAAAVKVSEEALMP
jgi:hypothetical protein